MTGLVLIGCFALVGLAHPILLATVWPPSVYDPRTGIDNRVDLLEIVADGAVIDPDTQVGLTEARLQNPFYRIGDQFARVTQPRPFTLRHPLGVDSLGRDVLSMTMAATWPSFVVGLVAATTTAVVGVGGASIAAYARGRTDLTIEQLSNTFMLLPAPLLVIILGAGPFGDRIGMVTFGLLYGVVAGLGATVVVVRTRALTIMSAPWIDAARVAGAGGRRIVSNHLLPHLLPIASLSVLAGVSGAIIADGFVSFLGFTAGRETWGGIVFWAISTPPPINGGVPWAALLAGTVSITAFSGAFYLLGIGIREAGDPSGLR